jgi:hypothetical protein
VTKRTAARLVRQARDRHRNGFRGWRARRAWRRLGRAGENGDPDVLDAVWRWWRRDRATDVLELLARWWSAPPLRDRMLRYAVDPAVPPGWRAAVGQRCAAQGLVPEDPVERVCFFVLTSQPERQRALDPDGTLLPIAYRAASRSTQRALREAMTGAGDLDVVGVIAGGGEPTGEEFAYLTRHLAGTGQWPALWRLVRGLPLAGAVDAMPLFEAWAPDDPAERHLFGLLAATPPGTLTAAIRTLAHHREPSIMSDATSVSFAPDRSEVVVALAGGGIRRYALPAKSRVGDLGTDVVRTKQVLHLGESVVAAQTTEDGVDRLVRFAHGDGAVIWTARSQTDGIWALTGAGDRFFAAKSGELLAGTMTTLREMTRYELGLISVFAYPVVVDFEPDSGRLAIAGRRTLDLSILDEDLLVVANRRDAPAAGVRDVLFAGQDRLVTVDVHGWVMRWRRAGHTLGLEHSVRVPVGGPSDADSRPSLCAVPAHGRLAVTGFDEVTWLDADTFETVPPPPGLNGGIARLWGSADGNSLAVEYRDGRSELRDWPLTDVAELLARPISAMTAGHLAIVTAARRADLAPAVTAALDLLHASLAHRFGAEISLGATTTAHVAADDIALGGAR